MVPVSRREPQTSSWTEEAFSLRPVESGRFSYLLSLRPSLVSFALSIVLTNPPGSSEEEILINEDMLAAQMFSGKKRAALSSLVRKS